MVNLPTPTAPTTPPQITEPYLQIYRGILPPLFGQLDFTPLVGFLILQVGQGGWGQERGGKGGCRHAARMHPCVPT